MRKFLSTCLIVAALMLVLISGCAIHYDSPHFDFKVLESPSLKSTIYSESSIFGDVWGGSFFHEPLRQD